MVDSTLTNLTGATTPLAGTELTYIVQGGNSRKATVQDIANLGGGGGPAAAGTLTGTTLATNVVNSSLTSVGTLNGLILAQNASPAYARGKLEYDTSNESLTFFNNDSNVALQVGQEDWIRVINNTGSTIANGAAVYLNGASAGLPTIALAQSNAAATTICAGLATESIANGATGYVTCIGSVRGIDTSAFTAGQMVFVSSSAAGGLTSTAPTAPNYRYRVGIVGVSSATVGTIHVTPSTAALGNGTANQVFGMNAAGSAQEVKSIASGTGISVAHAANSITINANLSTGVAGGQSAIGGTASGENLTLSSTSNVTKGSINFGTSSYNEATNTLNLVGSSLFTTPVTTGTGTTAGIQVTANSLTTGNGVDISSSSVSTGNVVSIAATGTAAGSNTKTGLKVQTSGANVTASQITYGAQFSNTSTGGGSTNVGAQFSATGASNNYAIIIPSGGGNMGIGVSAPALTDAIAIVGSDANRKSITVQNTNSAGNASFYFQNNRGSFTSYGGLLHGGTTIASSFFGVSSADKTLLISDGASSTGLCVGTLVAQPFILGTNSAERMRILSGGNVGIGITAPSARLHSVSTTEQLRVGYDTSNYYSTTVGSTGSVTFDAVGSGSNFTFADQVIVQAPVRLKGYTVATLPAGTQGDTAFVTDALAPTFLGILVGGGAVVTTAFYNGTNWVAQ